MGPKINTVPVGAADVTCSDHGAAYDGAHCPPEPIKCQHSNELISFHEDYF